LKNTKNECKSKINKVVSGAGLDEKFQAWSNDLGKWRKQLAKFRIDLEQWNIITGESKSKLNDMSQVSLII